MAIIFTCSIDDGHPSDLKMADLLKKHNLNGTFYIPIANREGLDVMTPPQMREVGQQFEIGSHTYDHCFLNSVGMTEAHFQVTEGKKILEDMLGNAVSGFCYPGGKYRRAHADLVERAGFNYARTTMNLCFDTGDNRFEMPTTCQFYPHPKSVYLRNFVRAGHWSKRHAGLALTFRTDGWVERLYKLFDYACANGSVFHMWSHSHDIDSLHAWRELDFFLAYASSIVPSHNRLNNQQLCSRFFPG